MNRYQELNHRKMISSFFFKRQIEKPTTVKDQIYLLDNEKKKT